MLITTLSMINDDDINFHSWNDDNNDNNTKDDDDNSFSNSEEIDCSGGDSAEEAP